MTAKSIGAALVGAVLVVSTAATAVTAEAAPTTARSAYVAVSIDAARMITMTTALQPGVNQFTVTSEKPSGFQLVRLADAYTLEDFETDLKGFDKEDIGALKNFEAHTTLIGGVSSVPGKPAKFWVDLEPGSYVALDVQGKTNASKWVVLSVAGVDTGATVRSGATIKAVRDAKWAKRPKAIPRKGRLTFKNRSTKNHFVILVKMKKGATLAEVKEFMMSEEGPPPVNFDKGLFTAVISPTRDLTISHRLPAGTYALMCFWPDADMGGMPHAAMGMIRTIKLR